MKKPLKREVDAAEREYASTLMRYGESNLATVRAYLRWQELKEKRAA